VFGMSSLRGRRRNILKIIRIRLKIKNRSVIKKKFWTMKKSTCWREYFTNNQEDLKNNSNGNKNHKYNSAE
jgi:hypothetical protein